MMKQYDKRNIALLIIVTTLITVSVYIFFQNKNNVALFIWKHFKNEKVASIFIEEKQDFYTAVGLYYFGNGAYDLEKSKQSFQKVLEINPNASYIHYQLGRIYFIEGDFKRSLEELHKELELHPKNSRTHYVLGLVYGYRNRAGDLNKAEKHFKLFTEWTSRTWAGHNDLAWIQIRLKKFKEAKATILLSFEKNPWTKETNPWLWTTLGIAELNIGSYTEARDAFLFARSISEKMDAQYFLSAYPGNDSKNAEEIFNQYKATLSFNLGIVYEKLGEKATAKAEYENYLKILPSGPYPKEDEIIQKIKALN